MPNGIEAKKIGQSENKIPRKSVPTQQNFIQI